MAKNLTTVYLLKEFAGIATNEDDRLLERLIDQVSEAIARYCGRTFEATTYREWYNGTGGSSLTLPQWPITNLYGVSLSTFKAAGISFTGGSWATCSLRSGVLYLDSIDTTGVETHTTITLSDYPTIGLLKTEVETNTGWSVTPESGKTTEPSQIIRPFDGEWALDAADVDFSIPDKTYYARLSAESNQTIERGARSTFPVGTANVFTWYKAGYTLPVDKANHADLETAGNVPDDLMLIAVEISKLVYESSTEEIGSMESEKTQTYSYKIRPGAAAMIQAALKDHEFVLTRHRSMKMI